RGPEEVRRAYAGDPWRRRPDRTAGHLGQGVSRAGQGREADRVPGRTARPDRQAQRPLQPGLAGLLEAVNVGRGMPAAGQAPTAGPYQPDSQARISCPAARAAGSPAKAAAAPATATPTARLIHAPCSAWLNISPPTTGEATSATAIRACAAPSIAPWRGSGVRTDRAARKVGLAMASPILTHSTAKTSTGMVPASPRTTKPVPSKVNIRTIRLLSLNLAPSQPSSVNCTSTLTAPSAIIK